MAETKIKAAQFFGVVGHGTDGYFLMTNADGTMTWSEVNTVINPTISSIDYPGSVTAADPAGSESITINGTGFITGASVTIGGTAAGSVSFVSATELTITTPAKAAGDYDIVVTNTDGGTATSINGISYNGVPAWTTAAGSLGTFASDTTISTITLQATEPDSGTITFSITNGTLPTGLSLTGADIDGTTTLETADTLYTFTVTATDDESQTTPRTFTITVTKQLISTENFTINTYTGNGSTQSIEGKIGTAAAFNGSSSYIQNSSLPSVFSGANTISISAWINTTSTASAGGEIIWSFSDNTAASTELACQVRNNKLQCFNRINGSHSAGPNFLSSTDVADGGWHHMVYVCSSSGTKFYFDGVEDTNRSFQDGTNASDVVAFTNMNVFSFGGNDDSSSGLESLYSGKIDQVRIFNKALSSSEVTTLYGESNTSTTKSTTDIFDDGSGVALYEFEEGAKDTGNTGTAIDSGQSGVFNGSSSYIDLPLTSLFGGKNTLSVSLWFKTTATSSQRIFTDYAQTSRNCDIRIDGGNIKIVTDYAATSDTHTTNLTYNDDNWHHLVVAISATQRTIYIDNSLLDTITLPSGSWDGYGQRVTLGAFYSSTSGYSGYFDGQIDDLRIYNDGLNGTEVGYIFNSDDANIPTGNLQAYYKLDGDATDETTNYNGTWSGTEAYSDPALRQHNGTPTNVNFLGMAFQPDLVWIKDRNVAEHPVIYDSIRGALKALLTSSSNKEYTHHTNTFTSFDTNGFTLGADTQQWVNTSGRNYVAWCLKGGGSASTYNIDGTGHGTLGAAGLSITGVNGNSPTFTGCSINTEAGFGIYEIDPNHTSSNHRTDFTHGLNSTPELVITKVLDGSGGNWHTFTNIIDGSTDRGKLNSDALFVDDTLNGVSIATSTEIRIEEAFTGAADRFLFYVFHSVDGYQKVGSYSGNGSTNGPTITTGFRPRFLLVKRVDVANDWLIFDSVRSPSNPLDDFLRANTGGIEAVNSDKDVDFLDDGFQMVNNQAALNASGTNNYIYLAIA